MNRTRYPFALLVAAIALCPAHFASAQAAPTTQAIKAVLDREFARIDAASTPRLMDSRTGAPVTDVTATTAPATPAPAAPDPNAAAPGGAGRRGGGGRGGGSPYAIDAPNLAGNRGAFQPTAYPYAVIYNGMLNAAANTGDAKFADFTVRWFTFIHDMAPKTAALGRGEPFARYNTPASMDDCGAISEAMMKAAVANIGPDMKPFIDRGITWVSTRQHRAPDGNLDRTQPVPPDTIWADDFYMGGAPLAWAGKFTGDTKYWDDDIKQTKLFAGHLYDKTDHLYAHGSFLSDPGNPPKVYWGRANGWCAMSLTELLTVLPDDYPGRDVVMAQYQDYMKGLIQYQAADGLWRQVINRPDVWEETSSSAMFTYAMCRGINKGWLDAATFGPVVTKAWSGLSSRVDADGHVTGTVAGTNLLRTTVVDNYINARPADDVHGYGPVLLAGSELYKVIDSGKLAAK